MFSVERDGFVSSCGTDARGNVEAVLGFGREQLLYDIRNCAYVEGGVMEDAGGRMVAAVRDVGEAGNVDRVTRVMDLAVARVRELLYPFTRDGVRAPVVDDRLRERPCYGIVLSLPADFSQTTLNYLGRLIHEYIVDRAVCDWLSITNPAKSEAWAARADEMESQIRVSVHSRLARVRRRMSVF